MNLTYKKIIPARPPRSVFDLSHEKKFTMDMGQLIPVMCEECIPGDIFMVGAEAVIRCQPMVAPPIQRLNAYIDYWFVPHRLTWPEVKTGSPPEPSDGFEVFITGGKTGLIAPTHPTWHPSDNSQNSLWDYFGHPVNVDPDGFYPSDLHKRAYNFIWNEIYRDQTYDDPLDIEIEEDVQLVRWEQDRFTSALATPQRGVAPTLPVSGTTSAVFDGNVNLVWPAVDQSYTAGTFQFDLGGTYPPYTANTKTALENGVAPKAGASGLDANSVDLSSATSVDINELRLAVQTQIFLERNARVGSRYIEQLIGRYGVAPKDERLQRPEWIGSIKQPIIFSEVLQTSESGTTAQGNLAGHGIAYGKQFVGKYRVEEFGVIIGLMFLRPSTVYQQGIQRQFIKQTRFDYPTPEYVNLGEQPVYRGEIYATGTDTENLTVFGYQGIYDEYRTRDSMVVGEMRDTFDYWHFSRQFSSAPALNSSFLECDPRKDVFADNADPGFIVNIGNMIKAVRPLPIIATPGRMDH